MARIPAYKGRQPFPDEPQRWNDPNAHKETCTMMTTQDVASERRGQNKAEQENERLD